MKKINVSESRSLHFVLHNEPKVGLDILIAQWYEDNEPEVKIFHLTRK